MRRNLAPLAARAALLSACGDEPCEAPAGVYDFESIRVESEWAGHYAMNTLDQNAITGPHPDIDNFLFLNGFSGHGLQQSPAMGRATAEWLTYGRYRSFDMTPFHFDRVVRGEPIVEKAVI